MRKYRPERVILRRVRDGRKRSRVQVGLRVLVFFVVTALLVGAFAIALNLKLQEALERRLQAAAEASR